MPRAWRAVKRRHAPEAFSGEGARIHGGRWNSPGHPVVYVAESRALAALELLAGLGSVSALESYVLVDVEFDVRLVESLDVTRLPENWQRSPPSLDTQAIGDRWFREGRSAVLRVPSVLIPPEWNYVLSPAHPDFEEIRVGEPVDFFLDPRLAP